MTIEQILEAIEQMKVTELNELVKAAEEKFGVSASAPVMVAAAAPFPTVLLPVRLIFYGILKRIGKITSKPEDGIL